MLSFCVSIAGFEKSDGWSFLFCLARLDLGGEFMCLNILFPRGEAKVLRFASIYDYPMASISTPWHRYLPIGIDGHQMASMTTQRH